MSGLGNDGDRLPEGGPEDGPSGPLTLRLREGSVTPEGRRHGLAGGEVLLAVNGLPFEGGETALATRLAMRKGKPLVLRFGREGGDLLVLAATMGLGRWEPVAAPPAAADEAARIDPDRYRNYEVMRDAAGQYDLFCVSLPMIAMMAPPLWFLQMRVWSPVATLLAALAAAAIVTPWLSVVVWMAAGLWMRGAALPLLRADRLARGLSPAGLVAARSEAEAHAAHQARMPGDRCIFCPEREATTQVA